MNAVESFIHAVEINLRKEVDRTPITQPALRLLDAGGKRLRARLLWWSANASAPTSLECGDRSSLIRAATAIELAHLGSLIHDDIVDGGDTRRGVPTLHRDYGVRIATDAGAALAHLATELVAPLGDHARRAVRRALLATCRGQIRELAVSFVVLSPQRRLAIMQEKTGALFELAAALGAIIGGGEPLQCAAVRRFARRFGVAFQIADDVFDLTGDPRELGRANGADLRDGVATLPVTMALDPEGFLSRALARVRTTPDADAIAACADAITKGGGIAAATAVAIRWLDRAIEALEPLGTSDDVAALTALARTSVERGLRPGRPVFVASASHVRPVGSDAAAPFIASAGGDDFSSTSSLDARLVRVLEWFHPGLALMVAARAVDPTVATTHATLRKRLLSAYQWSPEARLAADAIALAHGIVNDDALRNDAVRTLAMVDSLHCAAIGFLSLAPSAHEHERMAARARSLLVCRPPSSRPLIASRRDALLPEAASPA